jgi:hypothetical protein
MAKRRKPARSVRLSAFGGALALAFVLGFVFGFEAAPARAQTAAPAADAAPKVKVEKGAGGKKVYRITEEIRIEGKIQKPEAFFFYQKSTINYDWQELKQDFIPKILDSVSRSPF